MEIFQVKKTWTFVREKNDLKKMVVDPSKI